MEKIALFNLEKSVEEVEYTLGFEVKQGTNILHCNSTHWHR